ncbi:MAG: hypothetical protein ABWY49_07850 [Rhizobium sp.]
MLLVTLATTYLVLAFAIVLTVDHIAGLMFRVPREVAPSIFRFTPMRLFRKSVK